MAKPKWIIGAGLAIAASVALGGYWVLRPAPEVTHANCERLHQGMTFAQVEAILGEPKERDVAQAGRAQGWLAYWESEDVDVLIGFSAEGTVASGGWDWWEHGRDEACIATEIPPYRSPWSRVFSWIKW